MQIEYESDPDTKYCDTFNMKCHTAMNSTIISVRHFIAKVIIIIFLLLSVLLLSLALLPLFVSLSLNLLFLLLKMSILFQNRYYYSRFHVALST